MAFTRTARHVVAISPDGTKIAFIAKEQIYLRQIDELEARPIRGTDVDPIDFAFSPDGESIAFFVMGMVGGPSAKGATLKRIGVVGGKAVTVCPAGLPFGIRWQGSTIVFSLGDSIQRVDDRGGTPETLVSVKPDSGESFAQPQLLNEGRALLYTVRPGGARTFNDGQIVVQSLEPKGDRLVLVNGMDGRVVSSGLASPTPLPVDATKYISGALGRMYDVSRDGQQFLLVKPLNADEKRSQSLTIVTHWFDVLRAAMKGT